MTAVLTFTMLGLRSFSKLSRIIENEYYNNPHFSRAFPQLADKVPAPSEAPVDVSWRDSLSLKYKAPAQQGPLAIHEEDKLFVEGYRTPPGPLKWLSYEDKERVHGQILHRMNELENTGLSREKLLFDKSRGLPLRQDPVFQYLKTNKKAREMVLSPGEEFTAEKVIDFALRQDTGPDRSKALGNLRKKYSHELDEDYQFKMRTGQTYPEQIAPEDYYWSEKLEEKYDMYKRYFKNQGAYSPKFLPSRDKLRKKLRRYLNFSDIHFKNTEFLTQFMTPAGQIKNRWQTRLSTTAQKKVSKAIKHARNLNLFPFVGFLLPPHSKNLQPLNSEEFNSRVIHSETGTVFARKYEKTIEKTGDSIDFGTLESLALRFEGGKTELSDYNTVFSPESGQLKIIEALKYFQSGTGQGKELAETIRMNLSAMNVGDIGEFFVKEKAADEDIVEGRAIPKEGGDVGVLWGEIQRMKGALGVSSADLEPEWVRGLSE